MGNTLIVPQYSRLHQNINIPNLSTALTNEIQAVIFDPLVKMLFQYILSTNHNLDLKN